MSSNYISADSFDDLSRSDLIAKLVQSQLYANSLAKQLADIGASHTSNLQKISSLRAKVQSQEVELQWLVAQRDARSFEKLNLESEISYIQDELNSEISGIQEEKDSISNYLHDLSLERDNLISRVETLSASLRSSSNTPLTPSTSSLASQISSQDESVSFNQLSRLESRNSDLLSENLRLISVVTKVFSVLETLRRESSHTSLLLHQLQRDVSQYLSLRSSYETAMDLVRSYESLFQRYKNIISSASPLNRD